MGCHLGEHVDARQRPLDAWCRHGRACQRALQQAKQVAQLEVQVRWELLWGLVPRSLQQRSRERALCTETPPERILHEWVREAKCVESVVWVGVTQGDAERGHERGGRAASDVLP